MPHSFIAKRQSEFLKSCKLNLKSDEFVIISDFSENYSFTIQNETQSWHWANAQCTIHPFSVYFKNESDDIQHRSVIVIAESLKHDFAAVKLFQNKLLQYLKSTFSVIKKIYFFSDGAGGQYKNRFNFHNLCEMKYSENIDVEWHFFATSHGKGPCDAIGGTLKRLATKASLQRPFENQITTALDLYQWAISNNSNMHFIYCSSTEYENHNREFQDKMKKLKLKTVPGTRSYHSFIPIDNNIIETKEFSLSNEKRKFKLT